MTDSLIIAGRTISLAAILDFTPQIAPLHGGTRRRLGDGGLVNMSSWRKIKISISAKGWVPPAILAVDYSQPFEIELPIPWPMLPGDVLPAGVSVRNAPWGEHTVTDQTGGSTRFAYIKCTVFSDGPTYSRSGGEYPWSMEMEQV